MLSVHYNASPCTVMCDDINDYGYQSSNLQSAVRIKNYRYTHCLKWCVFHLTLDWHDLHTCMTKNKSICLLTSCLWQQRKWKALRVRKYTVSMVHISAFKRSLPMISMHLHFWRVFGLYGNTLVLLSPGLEEFLRSFQELCCLGDFAHWTDTERSIATH